MMLPANSEIRSPILYSCYVNRSREGEQFVSDHVFSYQISGTLTLNDGQRAFHFSAGDFRFVKRNHLVKFLKQPPPDGDFKSLTVYLDQETLRQVSREYGYRSEQNAREQAVLELEPNSLMQGYMESLQVYDLDNILMNEKLRSLKLKEAVLVLLETNPALQHVLFDFSEPGKIDLEAFMNRNFHFNVKLERFAYLSGRSLASFKRDFEKIFKTSPSRWLLSRRLQEAHYLIKEKGLSATDIYLDLGFEDLSHFSFAFKKIFGVPPSLVKA